MLLQADQLFTLSCTRSLSRSLTLRYDFFYLPIDFKHQCNKGFAFVNYIEPIWTASCHKQLHGKTWKHFCSQKVSLRVAGVSDEAADDGLLLLPLLSQSRAKTNSPPSMLLLSASPRSAR